MGWRNRERVHIGVIPALAAGLLAVLAVVNVYRAATQSITYDEAFTYFKYLLGPFSRVWTQYQADNHVLFTVLARTAIALFGVSELTLRLPTVIAGACFLAVVYVTCRDLFGYGAVFLVSVAAVALNPFVLDFLSVARGYGLALAAFTIGLHQLTRAVIDAQPALHRRWCRASLALGVSICAQLVFLFPALALALTALVLGAVQPDGARPTGRVGYLRQAVLWLATPGLLVIIAVLSVPLRHASRSQFEYGARDLAETVRSLVVPSLRHHAAPWPQLLTPRDERTIEWLIWAGASALAVLFAVVSGRLIVRFASAGTLAALTPIERFILLGAGTLSLTLLLLFAAHASTGLKYPSDRTGLYFLPVVTLTVAAVMHDLWATPGVARGSARAIFVVLLLLVARFATEVNVTHYYLWRFDAGSRAIFDVITRWPGRRAGVPVHVAARDVFEPALNFYRVTRGDPEIAPIPDEWAPGDWSYDFFVVSAESDLERVRGVATPVYVHPVSRVTLLLNNTGPQRIGR
jgi:hypothetical protein